MLDKWELWLIFFLLQDPRFNAEVDQITGYKTQSILCLPIKNHRDEVRDEFKQKISELLYNICYVLLKLDCYVLLMLKGCWSSASNQ